MKYFKFLFLLFSLVGCSTPKFYNEIVSTYPPGKQDDYVMGSSIQPYKIILRKLINDLKDSHHIIFHYTIDPEWYSKGFAGAVYDVDQKKYFYFSNSDRHPRKVEVDTVYKFPDDNYYKFVIDKYRTGEIGYLKELTKGTLISGFWADDVIYEIDLKSNLKRREVFEHILFMDGKPFDPKLETEKLLREINN